LGNTSKKQRAVPRVREPICSNTIIAFWVLGRFWIFWVLELNSTTQAEVVIFGCPVQGYFFLIFLGGFSETPSMFCLFFVFFLTPNFEAFLGVKKGNFS